MYAAGGAVKLIVSSHEPKNSSGSDDRQAVSAEATEFYFPAHLLRSSSPVFESILNGPWKESGDDAITINSFQPDAFRAFLDCLLLVANETASPGYSSIFIPSVIRKVLPIANYYQTETLKQKIVSIIITNRKTLRCDESCRHSNLRLVRVLERS